MKTIKEMYEKDENFRDYVDEYCENNECSLVDALKRETVIKKRIKMEKEGRKNNERNRRKIDGD